MRALRILRVEVNHLIHEGGRRMVAVQVDLVFEYGSGMKRIGNIVMVTMG